MKRQVKFYKTQEGKCPVTEFFDLLPGSVVKKITWVLSLVEDLEIIPTKYYKKLKGTDSIYECSIDMDGNTYRILGFFYGNEFIILTNGFMKKTTKTPKTEIEIAEWRKRKFVEKGGKV
jgi:phage-related protein